MQGAPGRQVNAEEMLAELKRALESAARAPNVPRASGSTASKSASPGWEGQRSQPEFQKSRSGWGGWKLTAGGVALAGAAAICAGLVFMNEETAPKRELSAVPAERPVRPQDEPALNPAGAPSAPAQQSPQSGAVQAGSSAPPPAASAAPAPSRLFRAREAADADAPNLASFGLESPPPILAPRLLNQAPALTRSERIGPDGAPIASPAPGAPAPQAGTPDKAAAPAPSPPARPEAATAAPAPTGSEAHAEPADEAAAPTPSPPAKPEADKAAAAPVPAPAAPAPHAETKASATPAEHTAGESERPSKATLHSTRKEPARTSPQRLARSAKASAKPVAQAERRATERAQPKDAERAPEPTQGAGAPTAVAPVSAPSAPQRFADGVTHAFGYLIHLPGALVSHPASPNADAR